ncbi:MAG: hypothetical protein AB1486_08140 [Planctomycetota bacterium]
MMDFGTAVTAFPISGAYPANYTVDPSGWTPDLARPYDAAPHTFPPGSFVTTSGSLSLRIFNPPIPYSIVTNDDVHGVVQFPPGDSGWLAVGAST